MTTKLTNFRLKEDTLAKMKELADKKQVSVTDIVRMALQEYLNKELGGKK